MAIDAKIPNIERIRELQAPYPKEAFCEKCGIPRQTLHRIYSGRRVELDTLKAIAAGFDLGVDELFLSEPSSDHTADRISHLELWPEFLDVARSAVVLGDTAAMRTFTEEARTLTTIRIQHVV